MFKKDMALGEMNARSANKRRLSVVTEKRTRKIFLDISVKKYNRGVGIC